MLNLGKEATNELQKDTKKDRLLYKGKCNVILVYKPIYWLFNIIDSLYSRSSR